MRSFVVIPNQTIWYVWHIVSNATQPMCNNALQITHPIHGLHEPMAIIELMGPARMHWRQCGGGGPFRAIEKWIIWGRQLKRNRKLTFFHRHITNIYIEIRPAINHPAAHQQQCIQETHKIFVIVGAYSKYLRKINWKSITWIVFVQNRAANSSHSWIRCAIHTDAIPNPWTMMIETCYTPIAHGTMFRSNGTSYQASRAEQGRLKSTATAFG